WATAAAAQARAAGVDLSAYQHVVYAFPQTTACVWSGLSYMPGSTSWINGDMSLRAVGHELGHNLGVNHASSLACTSNGVAVTLSTTCNVLEYGDPYTIMGSGATRLQDTWHLAELGWVSPQVVTTAGAYLVA